MSYMTLMAPHTLYETGIIWSPHMYDMIFFRPALKESTACLNEKNSLWKLTVANEHQPSHATMITSTMNFESVLLLVPDILN